MIRVLSMIAIAGFLLAVACIGAAVSLAGPDAVAHGAWNWSGHGWSWHGAHVQIGDGPESTRQLAWNGGEAVEVEIPAQVRFVQSDGPASVVVKGPKDAIDRIVVEDGRIHYDRPAVEADRVNIEIKAPRLQRFVLSGSGDLAIDNYRQDRLDIDLSGDTNVVARGAAKTVKLAISGSGEADLSRLAADGADVNISGSGEAKVAPKGWAKLDISGAGQVTLLTRPPRVETHVTGAGRVEQDEPDGESGRRT